MALYKYRALNAQGDLLQGHMAGSSQKDILRLLHCQQIHPLSLRRKWGISNHNQSIKVFFLYLGYALNAGYALVPALFMIKDTFRGFFRSLVESIHEKLTQGHLLSEACKDYPTVFSGTLVALIQLGEQSGNLALSCSHCHKYITQNQTQKANLLKALAYPLLNFFVLIIACIVLMATLLPNTMVILKESNAEIPMATKIILATFSLETALIISALIAVCFISLAFWKEQILFIFFGNFIAQVHYLQFFSALNVLIQEKLPLTTALFIACNGMKSVYLKKRLQILLQKIQEGKNFYQALTSLPYLGALYANILQIGELTGHQLDSFTSVIQLMTYEITRRREAVVAFLSPFLMIIVGVCFWILIEGTFIPLYENLGGFSDVV